MKEGLSAPQQKKPPVEKQPHETGQTQSGDMDLCVLLPEDPSLAHAEEILTRQEAQGKELTGLRQDVVAIQNGMTQLAKAIQSSAQHTKSLALANEEINRLGELHWNKHIVEPMVCHIFPMVDLISGYRAVAGQDAAKPDSQPLQAIKTMLTQYLAVYGIECYLPAHGARFNPRFMNATKVASTSEQKQHNRVRACLQMGFKWGQGAAIRPASVQLWRYQQPSHRPQQNSNQRKD